MDPVRWCYGSSKGDLMDLLVIRGHVWITGTLVDTARGPLIGPVRGREWIQYGDTYGSSEGALMDLPVVRGHLWITGFGYYAGMLMDQKYGDANGSITEARMDPVRGHLWIYL